MSNLQEIYKYFEEDKLPSLTEMLDSRMQKLNISQRSMSSDVLTIERKTLQRILSNEHQKLDILTLLKVGYFLNTDIEELIKICVASMTPEELKELEQARKSTFILENFDLEGLKKMGFIDKLDFSEIENKLLKFFGLETIYDYQRELGLILFSQTKRNYHNKMREFWLKSIEIAFKSIANLNEYKPELLKQLIERIPAYSKNEENGLFIVIRALYMVGVTVLVQPYPANTQVKGASFLIKKKPCIILSDYNKRYDTLWFSLIHELYHILYDYDILLKSNYHLSGENDLFLIEDNANKFARNMLLSPEKSQYIYKIINIPAMVSDFAKKWSIHPAIIYGFYIYDNPSENIKYRKLIPNTKLSLQNVQHSLFDFQTIEEGIQTIKEKNFTNLQI